MQQLIYMLKKEFRLAGQQGIELTVTEEAKEWLLAQNDQPEYGARPLRRIIARNLREPLADFLLTQTPKGTTEIIVNRDVTGLSFEMGK